MNAHRVEGKALDLGLVVKELRHAHQQMFEHAPAFLAVASVMIPLKVFGERLCSLGVDRNHPLDAMNPAGESQALSECGVGAPFDANIRPLFDPRSREYSTAARFDRGPQRQEGGANWVVTGERTLCFWHGAVRGDGTQHDGYRSLILSRSADGESDRIFGRVDVLCADDADIVAIEYIQAVEFVDNHRCDLCHRGL